MPSCPQPVRRSGLEQPAIMDAARLHLTTSVDGFTAEVGPKLCRECAERILEADRSESGPVATAADLTTAEPLLRPHVAVLILGRLRVRLCIRPIHARCLDD